MRSSPATPARPTLLRPPLRNPRKPQAMRGNIVAAVGVELGDTFRRREGLSRRRRGDGHDDDRDHRARLVRSAVPETRIESAMLDGRVTVDLTGRSRATLSAVASNSQSLLSKDESAAAAGAARPLRRRDDAACRDRAPHRQLCRDYQAAAAYLDEAGTDERATERAGRARARPSRARSSMRPNRNSARRPTRQRQRSGPRACSTRHPPAIPRRCPPTPRALPARRARC